MKEDDIELFYSVLENNLKEEKTQKISRATLYVLYRSILSNYSSTAFREFIITSKTLQIIRPIQGKNFIFIPENYVKYKKVKKQFGDAYGKEFTP